jgi:hypothetical protein
MLFDTEPMTSKLKACSRIELVKNSAKKHFSEATY